MNDADGHRIDAAEQFGFIGTDAPHDVDEGAYACTVTQLIAFSKACERAGVAAAAILAQNKAHEYRLHHMSVGGVALDALAADLNRINEIVDAELAPILEAEETRFMTAQGYVRGSGVEPGTRWVKPVPPVIVIPDVGPIRIVPDVSHGFHVFRDGNAWCAVGPHFNSLADSTVGFGATPVEAVMTLRGALLKARPDTYRRHALPTFGHFTVHE